jgi:hypothetical protein
MTPKLTLPLEEFFEFYGDHKSELQAFAASIGRPDRSLTVEEFARFLGDRGRPISDAYKDVLDDIAMMYATYPTGREGARRALMAHIEEVLETLEDRRRRGPVGWFAWHLSWWRFRVSTWLEEFRGGRT